MMPVEIFSMTYRPFLAVLFPAIGAILILTSGRHPNIRESWTMIASVLCFASVFSMVSTLLSEGPIDCTLFQIFPGVDFAYRVDAFGLIFALTSSSLWIMVSIYSIGYMRTLEEHAQTRYYFCFCWAIFGAIGTALAGNLVTMFIHYEILTVSTYPLVAHDESPEALFAGRKYLAYLLTAGCFLLGAILITYWLTGTTDFEPNGILTIGSASKLILQALFVCFILGFMKAAYMPFHSWLPTAMIAPTPVSALLHAVAVVKAGVFGIIRTVCYVYGIDLMHALGLGIFLACWASFTMIVANLFAIGEDNLKRRLAYSTINQLSFIILGVALLSPMSVTGAMIHIPFHGFMKITLFLCAGAMIAITGKTEVSQMAGIARQIPVTMKAFTIGAFGMCGIPPIAGFISKWYICLGSVQAGMIPFVFVAVIASLLDVVYFFPIIRTAFFEKPLETNGGEREVRNKETEQPIYLFMVIPLAITAIFSIVFCLFPNSFHIFDLAQMAVRNIFGGV
jgi:formate hydrogenlyase subunit 3/multisubunit Na+/H+ antiporter MnhD subunit